MKLTRRLAPIAAACALAALTSCAPPPPPPPPPPPAAEQMPPAIGQYGNNIIQTIKSDAILANILTSHGITRTVPVGLIIDPNGYVEKGIIQSNALPPDVGEAVVQHLINVNFGNFLPGMPSHKLVFVVPVGPPGP